MDVRREDTFGTRSGSVEIMLWCLKHTGVNSTKNLLKTHRSSRKELDGPEMLRSQVET